MPQPKLPTPEEIHIAYQQGEPAVQALFQELCVAVAQLAEQVTTLQNQRHKDSHNSHKPPSSDGPAKPARPRSLRKRSGKKSGGQVGHSGTTLAFVASPDITLSHLPTVCQACGTSLAGAPIVQQDRRQVFELPKPRPEVTEHQVGHQACPHCQTITAGVFPPEVAQPVQYGPRAKATAVYLQTYQLLSYERTAEALADLFGLPVSEGTLATAQQTAYTQLAPVEQALRVALQQAPVVHADETGVRVANRLAWVHVLGTPGLTFYAHHAKRGREAFLAIGLLLLVLGRRVHDAWAPYLKLPGAYALCNAHLLRELIGLVETTAQPWLQKFIRLLLHMKTVVEEARAAGLTALPPKQCAGFEAAYTCFVNEGLQANPPPVKIPGQRGRLKQTPARNLLERLTKHRAAILAFLYDFKVPFDNNQAERDLRMFKVKHKISGCFRSAAGVDYFCRIRGYISTLRKQDYPILDALTSVFAGKPYMPRLNA